MGARYGSDTATMRHHNLVSQGKAYARAILLGRIEGFKQMFDSVLKDARSIVRNRNVGHAIGQCGPHLDTCFVAPFERLSSITHEVDEGERQQMGGSA